VYLTNDWVECQMVDNKSYCPIGFNGYNKNGEFFSLQGIVIEGNNVILKTYKNNKEAKMLMKNYILKNETITNEEYDINMDIIFRDNKILIIDPLLTNSLFTKLYFLDGEGLEHFEKFDERRSITGNVIKVWKVKW
jgi:dolichyl-diphosphooligosaccharide--protein glycosyltransferase